MCETLILLTTLPSLDHQSPDLPNSGNADLVHAHTFLLPCLTAPVSFPPPPYTHRFIRFIPLLASRFVIKKQAAILPWHQQEDLSKNFILMQTLSQFSLSQAIRGIKFLLLCSFHAQTIFQTIFFHNKPTTRFIISTLQQFSNSILYLVDFAFSFVNVCKQTELSD